MSTFEFNAKFGKLENLLYSFAYNLTKDADDAKDLYQETAFRALSNKDKFRPGTNFKAWVITIMRNIFINNYRRKRKAGVFMDSTDNNYFINSGSKAISNGGEASTLMNELDEMVEDLDENIRMPFLMHFYGYKYQEIADHLELPLGTVKSRIFFARKELKEKIQAAYGERPSTY